MSITNISTADAALLRTHQAHQYRLRLNAVPKVIVATAQINQASFTYPIASLTIDNTWNWSAAKVGQAFWIGTEPGTYDVTAGVVKAVPTSTTLYMDAKSLGDPGYASYIHNGLSDNLYITILKHRPLWGMLSSIRSGVFYKQWDVAYSDEGSNLNPLARIGRHRAAEANASGLATLTFTANPATWGAKTITGHSWNLDGGALVGGSLTGTTVTVEFAPGFYVIEYTVTDSGSKSQTAFRYLWVNPYGDTGTHASFGSRFRCEINRDSQDVQGRDLELTVSGTLTQDDVFPGQAFLLTEDALYGGQRLADDDSRIHTYIGYIPEVRPLRQKVQRSVGLKLQSPLKAASSVPTAPQLVQEVSTPTNWAQATSTLTNPVGGIWYVLKHHAPTFLAAHDFEFVASLLLYREQSLKFQQDDLLGQLTAFDETMPGTLGCRSDGTMVLTPSPMHMNNADRNALPTKFTWDGGDVNGEQGLDYPYSFPLKVGQVKAFAFAYDGGLESRPYASLAPGKAQAQGKGKPQVSFTVPYSDALTEQSRLNELSGHQFALENAPLPELGFTVDRNLDIAEPADRHVWHLLNIPAELDPYGIGFEGQRCLPTRVSRTWRRGKNGTLLKSVRVEFQLETYGQPGVTIPVEKEGWQDWVTDGWSDQLDVPFDPKTELEPPVDDGEGTPPGPGEYLVNFGASGWTDYAEWPAGFGGVYTVGAGGNPGNAGLLADTENALFIGQSFNSGFGIQVNLETGRTVTAIEFDFSVEWDNVTVSSITSYAGTTFDAPTTQSETILEGWGTRLRSGLSASGVTTIYVKITASGNCTIVGACTFTFKIDNIRITYSA